MSTQINQEMVDLDPQAIAWLDTYIETKAKIKQLQELLDKAQEHVKAALGDCETGLVHGREAVRWKSVESKRVDVTKLRELLPPQVLDLVEVHQTTRRFTIVEADE